MKKSSLGALDIVIEDVGGVAVQTDPNGLVLAAISAPTTVAFAANLGVGDPVAPSALSGRPGYRFKTNEVTIPLAIDELHRLVNLDLQPEEYFGLVAKFGVFHEIHDDFYDPISGAALQSRCERPASRKLGM